MRYARLGQTDLHLSRVGFGSWVMSGPSNPSYWGPQDDQDSIAAITSGVERGVNWVDTAAIYGMGHAEEVVGLALAKLPETDRPYVFTKGGMVWDRPGAGASVSKAGGRDSLRSEVEASLSRLGVEHIDLYQMHWPADDTRVEEYWATFAELIEEGKIRYAGLSNHSVSQMETAQSVATVHAAQVPLSIIRQDALVDAVPWARKSSVGVLAYSPLASGLLTGKYVRDGLDGLDPDDWRRTNPAFSSESLEALRPLVATLDDIATSRGVSTAEVAIAWTLAQAGVTAAIVGARSSGQVDGWIGAADIELTDEELRAVDLATPGV